MNRGSTRALVILCLVSFTVNVGFSALTPVLPYLVLALKGLLTELPELTTSIAAHKGALAFGLLMATFMAARAPMAALSGFLSDVIGRRGTMAAGLALYLLASLGFLYSNSIALFALFRGVQGMASAMVWPVAQAYLADATPRWQRGRAISIYTASMLIAETAGPSIGVAVYKLYVDLFGGADVVAALKAPLVLLAACCVLSLCLMSLLPRVPSELAGQGLRRGIRRVTKRLGSLPREAARSVRVMYVNGFINGVAMGILNTAAVVYIIEEVTHDPAYIGLFFMVYGVAAIPAALVAGHVSDRLRRRKPIVVAGYSVGRAVLFAVPLIRNYALLLGVAALLSLVFGLSAPVMRALQADIVPSAVRGSVFGFQQLFFNGGTLVGALLGGYLTQSFAPLTLNILGLRVTGYAAPFWIAGALGVVTAVLFAAYVVEPPS